MTLEEQFPWGASVSARTPWRERGDLLVGCDRHRSDATRDPCPSLKLTNTYELGSFIVDKIVDGCENQDGEAVDYGSSRRG